MTLPNFMLRRIHVARGFLLAAYAALIGVVHAADDPNPYPYPNNSFAVPGYPASPTLQRSNLPQGSTSPNNPQPGTDANGQGPMQGAQNPQGQGQSQGQGQGQGQRNANPSGNRTPQPGANDPSMRRFEPPPPKPSEFQRFVEAATGRLLPFFGAGFFTDAANGAGPLDNVPVSADYTVGPGDEIVLRTWGSIDVDYRATVDRNGLINLPKVGSFNVAGVKAADLEKNLRSQLGRLFTNFDMSVSLGQLRGLKVFVVGPAQRPGVYALASQSTLLTVMVMAGGPSSTGSMRKVLLRRDGRVISELDLYDFLVQGDKSKDVQLAAGDVIVFQPAGPRVALTGALDLAAIYELRNPQEPVRDVLRYAGGTPSLANPNRAQLERIDVTQPRAARSVEEFRLDTVGLQKPLRDGDVLTLLPISPQFANAVTLKGHVAQPLRYPFKPGMRIRDLIPDADALVTPDFYRRKNLLVQVVEDEEDERIAAEDAMMNPNASPYPNGAAAPATAASASAASRMPRTRSERQRAREDRSLVEQSRRAPTALFDELNWDYAVVERLNPTDLTTEVIPFNLGKAVLQADPASNIELRAGDVVTVYGQKDIRVPVSRQTRLVSVEGEVRSPGVYQLQPGETLKGLIERAGSVTPQAYLYGIEFSREETRRRQRENLTAAVIRLEALAAVQTARDAANRRDDPAGAATSAAVSNAATQAQLARLRAAQPNGRIALELDAATNATTSLPDVPLEAGDRIVIPPRPGFVTVAGAVVNSNAFLWRSGRTAGEYLRLAGADEAADPSNMFILRADGTVSHAGDKRGLFGRTSLESQVMQPGDALVVPNQLDFETWGRALVRNLKDFSQIFSGFGLGLAALRSL
jgi:polysaccharide biosynthesis/export protein